MFYVSEYQNNTVTSWSYDDKATAFEKFFDVARYIPKSQLEIHTVTITDATGSHQFPAITKSIVK